MVPLKVPEDMKMKGMHGEGAGQGYGENGMEMKGMPGEVLVKDM